MVVLASYFGGGGRIDINVDQPIDDLKLLVLSNDPVEVIISGRYASNVTTLIATSYAKTPKVSGIANERVQLLTFTSNANYLVPTFDDPRGGTLMTGPFVPDDKSLVWGPLDEPSSDGLSAVQVRAFAKARLKGTAIRYLVALPYSFDATVRLSKLSELAP